jgi:thioredoxin-dependent peroxiredoxin
MGKIALLKEGKKAPLFTLPDKDGEARKLKDLIGEFTVLFFYPKDNTPGCTIEAKNFSKDLKKFDSLGISVIGISGGDEKSKTLFCKKNRLKTILLSDTDFAVAKKYGVYGEKKFMGRTYLGIHRITFILNKQLKLVKVFDQVAPETHAKEILEFISHIPKKVGLARN